MISRRMNGGGGSDRFYLSAFGMDIVPLCDGFGRGKDCHMCLPSHSIIVGCV